MPERYRYIAFNKPFGVLTQFSDSSGQNRQTLKNYINIPGVYPVGRLDRDSEGLLLLTDDGNFQHLVTDPRFAHTRTYWAQVEGMPSTEDLRRLAMGVTIQGVRTRPAEVRVLAGEPQLPPRDPLIRFRKTVPTSWLEITLTEGRNRQVRRMTAAVGLPTLRLVRVAIGSVLLDGLEPGDWRHLSAAEVAA